MPGGKVSWIQARERAGVFLQFSLTLQGLWQAPDACLKVPEAFAHPGHQTLLTPSMAWDRMLCVLYRNHRGF
ncbi:uncharacterized protein UV8b_07166 [Ustilaginoidea virens]|uniref:Uncharacterized protein n=1 Tax=Ustilaginoidea virens TaxID=1159556 RepID=A0A8E5HWJ0_USTVR|nr:uncharacterized protein UV8b_07166 [Ustilaginoidea virens]QUC22925.1 hypothetical protein UV8b_07166 [Ustilaginoidea virens]